MSLPSGTRLGPYEIAAPIGAGGMGEVYRATDTNLKRQVAIKVLPESVAADAERLARFQREAEVLASLNHPNIAQIHGLERSDGQTALVMELVEGPTLADRIAQGPIPVDEALPIAKQIAEALEAAHEQGIIHRDLKPANIKLRHDGMVKVLDFGLAKAMEPAAAASPSASMSPTITTPAMTQAGIVLGTAAYMSPEQAKGRAVDARADVWAFGAVLYEMLTGRRAFEGDDVSEVFAGVIKLDPDWSALPVLPPLVGSFLKQCLMKDPRQRLAHMQDMRLALEGAFETAVPGVADFVAVAQPAWRQSLPLAAATLVIGVLVTALAAWSLWPSTEPGVVRRFAYDLPAGEAFRGINRSVIAISPDAGAVVYNTTGGLYLRTAGELEARWIPGTEGELASPVFSPDGLQVAYFSNGRLLRVNTSVGLPVVVADIEANPFGLSWGTDGTLLVGQPDGVYRVPATGGTPALVVSAKDGERIDGPRLLPDGDLVLFSATTSEWDEAQIVAQSLTTGERIVLIEGGSDARYVPTGHIVYARGEGLLAVAFDVGSRSVSGGAVPILQGVQRTLTRATGAAQYDVSDSGTLVYLPRFGTTARRTLVWVNRDGSEVPIPIEPSAYVYPRISPDGSRVALDDRNPEDDLWVWDFGLETRTRLTVGERGGQFPVWTPDGNRIAYSNNVGGIAWKAANNAGTAVQLVDVLGREGSGNPLPYFFTTNGAAIVFREQANPARGDGIGMIELQDGVEPAWLLDDELANDRNGELSPNGRWMAYQSDESGRWEIHVRPFPNVDDGVVQVSNAGGTRPLWSRDGRELYYLEPQGNAGDRLMSVAVRPDGSTFAVDARTSLMDWPYLGETFGATGRTYDVSVDGQRFLAISETGGAAASPSEIVLVQNFFAEVERLLPTN